MNQESRAAFIIAQAACAQAEIAGMMSENMLAMVTQKDLIYTKADFDDLIMKYGIHHNAVLTYLGEE